MKKFFTLILTAFVALSASAQKIVFTDDISAGSVTGFEVDGLVLSVVDDNGKLSVDSNNAYFGTATEYEKYDHRLKTGGKSGAANHITLTIPAGGTLSFGVRSASSGATDRNVVISQNEEVLYDQVVLEADAVQVLFDGADKETSIHPIRTVSVAAGEVLVEYPVSALNFYFFELETSTGVKSFLTAEDVMNGKSFNIAGQAVNGNAKGMVIKNGKKFWVK